jgi:hypothetical protein
LEIDEEAKEKEKRDSFDDFEPDFVISCGFWFECQINGHCAYAIPFSFIQWFWLQHNFMMRIMPTIVIPLRASRQRSLCFDEFDMSSVCALEVIY